MEKKLSYFHSDQQVYRQKFNPNLYQHQLNKTKIIINFFFSII